MSLVQRAAARAVPRGPGDWPSSQIIAGNFSVATERFD
jgi:hypothetical protein